MSHKEKTEKSRKFITDVFTGADGGVNFCYFRFGIENIAENADLGDKKAIEVLNIMYDFENLIRAVIKRRKI